MPKFVANREALKASVRGEARYEDGAPVRLAPTAPAASPEPPAPDPGLARLEALMEQLTRALTTLSAQHQQALASASRQVPDLVAALAPLLARAEPEPPPAAAPPEQWRFTIRRDSAGRMATVDAEAIIFAHDARKLS